MISAIFVLQAQFKFLDLFFQPSYLAIRFAILFLENKFRIINKLSLPTIILGRCDINIVTDVSDRLFIQ
jgi:hypothetical protein